MVDVQVDIDALKAFAKAISGEQSGLLHRMDHDDELQSCLAAVDPQKAKPPLDVGQGFPYPQFGSAHELAQRYADGFGQWYGNFQELRNALLVLAAAASTIASNYDSAQDFDAVSAKSVDDAFDAAGGHG